MKKFYILMVALMATVAANAADWYVRGEFNGSTDWDNGLMLTPNGNENEVSVKLSEVGDQIKFVNGNDWYCAEGAVNGKWEYGKDYKLSTSVGGNISFTENAQNVTLTINTQDLTFKATLEGTEPDPGPVTPEFAKWYLAGQNINGEEHWANDIEMTTEDGVVYTCTVESISDRFKIKPADSWHCISQNNTGAYITIGEPFQGQLIDEDPGFQLRETYTNATITANVKTYQITVTVEGGDTPVDPEIPEDPETTWWVDFGDNNEVEIDHKADGEHTLFIDIQSIPANKMRIIKKVGTEVVTVYGNTNDGSYTVKAGTAIYLKPNDVAYINFAADFDLQSRYLAVVNTHPNISNQQITITFTSTASFGEFSQMYVFGNNFDYAAHKGQDGFVTGEDGSVNWHANKGQLMTMLEGRNQVFFAQDVEIFQSTKHEGLGLIGFCENNGTTSTDWDAVNAKRIGPMFDPYSLEVEGRDRTDAVAFKTNSNVYGVYPGTYDIVVDNNMMRVRFYKNTDVPEQLYLNGDLGFYTHYEESLPMTKGEQDGDIVEFYIKGVRVVAADGAYGCDDDALLDGRIEFSTKPLSPKAKSAHRRAFGEPASDGIGKDVNVGHRYDANGNVGYEGANDYTIQPTNVKPGSYDITMKFNTTTGERSVETTASTQTGVEDLNADTLAPVEYYNLQGIRVENPENGIFIRRQGNNVTKVVL